MKKKALALLLSTLMLVPTMALAAPIGAATYNDPVVEALYFTDESGLVQLKALGRKAMLPRVVLVKPEDGLAFNGKLVVEALDAEGNVVATQTFTLNATSTLHTETVFGITRTVYEGKPMDLPETAVSARARYLAFNGTERGVAYYDPVPDSEGYVGRIHLPEPFASMSSGMFTVSKEEGLRKYSTTMSAYNLHDWSDATEIFLSTGVDHASSDVRNRTGLEREEPITGRNFAENYKAGYYVDSNGDIQNNFIFTLVDDFYSGSVSASGSSVHTIPVNNLSYNNKLGTGVAINALIRSGSPSGITWMGSLKTQTDPDIAEKWAPVAGYPGVYATKQKTNNRISTLFNFEARDEYGIPRPYILCDLFRDSACQLLDEAASLAACAETEGTFFQSADGLTVYCHPRKGEDVEDISLNWRDSFLSGIRNGSSCSLQTIIFENIGFMPRVTDHVNNQFCGGDYLKSVFGFIGCKFSGSAANTVGMTGKYTVYLNDCVAAYGFRDNYNYHSAFEGTESSRAIEINCISYMNGDFNRIYNEDHPVENSANSNNASTAHDAMYILRVGGRYFNSQGHHVGDTGCTMTLSVGTEVYDILYSPSHAMGISIGDTAQGCAIDCYVTGMRMRYSVATGPKNSHILDICGMASIGKSGQRYDVPTLTWEEVAAGEWGTDPSVIPEHWLVEWVEPSDPSIPDVPDGPDGPDAPDGPDGPDAPDDPDGPDGPDAPDDPDVPSEPSEPSEPSKPSEPSEPAEPAPAKGCGGSLSGGAILSLGAAAALTLHKKKKNGDD